LSVLVTQDSRNSIYVALSDFNNAKQLTSEDYAFIEVKKVPPRLLAPEYVSQSDPKKYTKACDLYSFSFFALDLLTDPEQALTGTTATTCPEDCPDWLWSIIERCGSSFPSERPSFHEILSTIESNSFSSNQVSGEGDSQDNDSLYHRDLVERINHTHSVIDLEIES